MSERIKQIKLLGGRAMLGVGSAYVGHKSKAPALRKKIQFKKCY